MDDLARRFINLIDCLYESRVIVICSAENRLKYLYHKGNLRQTFERTQSRLTEMQSQSYFSQSKMTHYLSGETDEKTH